MAPTPRCLSSSQSFSQLRICTILPYLVPLRPCSQEKIQHLENELESLEKDNEGLQVPMAPALRCRLGPRRSVCHPPPPPKGVHLLGWGWVRLLLAVKVLREVTVRPSEAQSFRGATGSGHRSARGKGVAKGPAELTLRLPPLAWELPCGPTPTFLSIVCGD